MHLQQQASSRGPRAARRLEGWPRARALPVAILRDGRAKGRGLLRMRVVGAVLVLRAGVAAAERRYERAGQSQAGVAAVSGGGCGGALGDLSRQRREADRGGL